VHLNLLFLSYPAVLFAAAGFLALAVAARIVCVSRISTALPPKARAGNVMELLAHRSMTTRLDGEEYEEMSYAQMRVVVALQVAS
jgi:hypothetical protein